MESAEARHRIKTGKLYAKPTCHKLARCARASAPERPERSPTPRAHQPWHLARLAPTRRGKAHNHHIGNLIVMLTAGTAVPERDPLREPQHLPLGRAQLVGKRVVHLAHTPLLSCAPVHHRPRHTADARSATARDRRHTADTPAGPVPTWRAYASGSTEVELGHPAPPSSAARPHGVPSSSGRAPASECGSLVSHNSDCALPPSAEYAAPSAR